jgi:hypothetical protein
MNSRYRRATFLVLAIVIFSSGSAQSELKSTRTAVRSTTLLINKDDGHKLKLNKGENALDAPTQFNCDSESSCVVTVQTMVAVTAANASWRVCVKIDDEAVRPNCPIQERGEQGPNTGATLGSAQVSSGSHTFQTTVVVQQSTEPPVVTAWEVHYTIYGQ